MVTELRVHGVTGSPAEDVLDRPLLRRVAGDTDAGFFRPRAEYGAITGPGGATLEAYRWGNLTAGAAARALWLLLLPFMFANVALWLRPATRPGPRAAIRALVRVYALSMTGSFVLSFTEVAVDLVGWQCASLPRCLEGRGYLALFADGFFATTGRRMALAALGPVLAIAFLWFLGRRTWARYEAFPAQTEGDGDGLAHPCFWNGKPLVGRLRSLHIAFAFATLDAILLSNLLPHGWRGPGLVLAALTALILVLCFVAVAVRAVVDRDNPARWARPGTRLLSHAAVGLTVLVLGYALLPRDPWTAGGRLPVLGGTITGLFAAQVVLLLVLGAVVLASRPHGTFLQGLAGPLIASAGLGVAVAFSAGLAYRAADFLDRRARPSSADYAAWQPLQPPPAYEWAAAGFVLLLLLTVIVAVAGGLPLVRRLRRYARVVTDADFRGGRERDAARAGHVDRAVADALVTDHIGRMLVWVFIPAALAAVAATGFAIAARRPISLFPSGSTGAEVISFAVNLGTYLIGFSAFALVLIGVLAYRYQRFRRIVGVLWDLGTFWPRAAHPLAPPCYAERVVPELARRGSWLAAEQGGVILSGHSQGSVLVAATVLQMPPEAQARTALLTYGSPLRRLYARFFPAYLGDDVLAEVGAVLTRPGAPVEPEPEPGQHTPRWVNLWRDTDPIGGPVQSPAARDVRLVDPPGFAIPPGDTVYPKVDGHSGYQLRPEFGAVVRALVADLAPRRPSTPSSPSPVPPASAPPAAAPPAAAPPAAAPPAAAPPPPRGDAGPGPASAASAEGAAASAADT
ncbi:hypothetical protein [Dactylosporangium sp. McL0621]|uniref:hypothetical protein n=1 Tax=Dactylosporangium sp. McL0621 TaxID=3415678 RepID=UPI003CF80B5B